MVKPKANKPKNKSPVNDLQRKVRFLSDKPLEAEEEQADRFGHSGIAESLKEVILTCPVPFTIGLFGKWGTGKTTILNFLKDKLSSENVAVVNFDVWKHEEDALRRTFLKEMVKQLQGQELLKNFELSANIDKSTNTETEFKKTDKISFILIAILIAIIIGIGIGLFFLDKLLAEGYFSAVAGSSLVGAILIFIFQNMIIKSHITETRDRFKDPVEFESEFFRIIENIDSNRLLIAVDNLDRCTHRNAVKLLSTVKTFLAKDKETAKKNNSIFLIPCDDEAIKKHLESVYSKDQKAFNSDEFLRKFFNAFLVLPDFIDTELQTYTEELLRETNITQFDSPDLAFVINTAFRDNPRQIKQFINILISHFLMAQNREAGDKPLICPAGTITENIPFLSKFLVIRQKFPDMYKTITQRYLAPEEWGQYDDTDFKNFHTATNMLTVADVRPFIYLKQSPEELQIPGLREIERGLTENNEDVVAERLKSIKSEPDKLRYFNTFLLNLLRRYRYVKPSLINILSCSLAISKRLELSLSNQFYRHFAHLINDTDGLSESLYQFNAPLIFSGLLGNCKETHREGIISEYVNYFCLPRDEKDTTKITSDPKAGKGFIGRNYAYELLKEFRQYRSWLRDDQRTRVSRAIEKVYFDDIEVLSLFEEDREHQKDFLSEGIVSGFISGFSPDDLADIPSIARKVGLVVKFEPIIKRKATASLLNKLLELVEAENKLPLEPLEDGSSRKQNFLNLLEEILGIVVCRVTAGELQHQLNSLGDKLQEGIENLEDWNQRRIFIFSCLSLRDFLPDPYKVKIDQQVGEFFKNADLHSFQFVFENKRLSGAKQSYLIERYPNILRERIIRDESFFAYLYPMVSKEIKVNWLVALIKSHPERAIQKLKSEEYKTDDDKMIVGTLLNKVNSVAVQEKTDIYSVVSRMNCANDAGLKATLGKQIKSLLTKTDQSNQEVGYNTLDSARSYLSDKTRREIATKVIDWLRSPQISEPYQQHAINSVILSWEILFDPAKNEYIYFIFHNLIMPRSNLEAIRLGFEVLSRLNILYQENRNYFDDTISATESETKEDIKTELVNGLISLKPRRTNKENERFWTRVDKLRPDTDNKDKSA